MRKFLLVLLLFSVLLVSFTPKVFGDNNFLKYKWFYVLTGFQSDNEVDRLTEIITTASEHGFNGMVLAISKLRLDNDLYVQRMLQVKKVCDEKKIAIIPMMFSAGRGSYILDINKNLAEGLRVEHDRYQVRGKTAAFVPLPSNFKNPGFESSSGNEADGYSFQEGPGQISFIDKQIKRSGNKSLRFEILGSHSRGQVTQDISVEPHKCYRFSCWVRASALKPEGAFSIELFGGDGRRLLPFTYKLKNDDQWQKVTMGFNSLGYRVISLTVGVSKAKSGTFWLDDLSLENVSMVNVLRRPGAPIIVKNSTTGEAYEEGKDYATITDPSMDFDFSHEGPTINILPDGKIKNGVSLDVSYYHSITVKNNQISICMSEPEVYALWRKQLQRISDIFSPHQFFLSMDEIRAAGSCWACRKRNLTTSQILGDCVTKQYEMIREIDPKAKVFCWADMFDPNMNAYADYFVTEGGFDKSWEYIPKDIVMVCWGAKPRTDSLRHFSEHGFPTMAASYYDNPNLDNVIDWLELLKETPQSTGMIYTTWKSNYSLLGEFGDIISRN